MPDKSPIYEAVTLEPCQTPAVIVPTVAMPVLPVNVDQAGKPPDIVRTCPAVPVAKAE